MNTNQRLRQIKDDHGLTKARIAELTASSIHAADQWLVSDKAKKHRIMPAAKLELLEMKLENHMNREQAIKKASRIAYDKDSTQVVGMLNGDWVIRDREDPESDQLKEATEVAGYGEVLR